MKRGLAIFLLILIPLNTFALITEQDIESFSDELAETGKSAWNKFINKIGELKIGQFFTNLSDTLTTWWSTQAMPWLEINFNEAIHFFNKEIIIQ